MISPLNSTVIEAPTETRPAAQPALEPIPREAFPENPNDTSGVRRTIIEEIERIGRKYAQPQE